MSNRVTRDKDWSSSAVTTQHSNSKQTEISIVFDGKEHSWRALDCGRLLQEDVNVEWNTILESFRTYLCIYYVFLIIYPI